MGGAFLPVQLLLRTAFVTVGVDAGHQVLGDLAELGGIEGLGLAQHRHHPLGSELGVAGEVLDRVPDDLRLRGGEPAVGHSFAHGGQQWFVDRGRQPDHRLAAALVTPR